MRKKSLLERIPIDPYLRAAAEVSITVFFTFFPIALLSIPLRGNENGLSKENVWENFWSYWTAGELVLPILGLCGVIASAAAINNRILNKFWAFFAPIVAVGCALAAGYALGDSNGFKNELYPQIISFGFVLYFLMLVFWFFLSVSVNSTSERLNPEERALALLRKKKEAASRGSNT
jgi:hypothetical protein